VVSSLSTTDRHFSAFFSFFRGSASIFSLYNPEVSSSLPPVWTFRRNPPRGRMSLFYSSLFLGISSRLFFSDMLGSTSFRKRNFTPSASPYNPREANSPCRLHLQLRLLPLSPAFRRVGSLLFSAVTEAKP